jgi:aminopeptidase N
VRPWIEQEGYPVVSIRRVTSRGQPELELRQQRFTEQPQRKRAGTARDATLWPIPWLGRFGGSRGGRGKLERHLLRGAVTRIPLENAPRFIYANAEESGFFRPLHDAAEIRQLANNLDSLSAVERMGLIDHQWAHVRGGRASIGALLELADRFRDEDDADVLETLRQPLGFIAESLIPEAAPRCEEPFRIWLHDLFEGSFAELGWKPAAREPDAIRLRRAALLGIAGGIAASPSVVEEAAARCQHYLRDRRSIDANLADSVVVLGAQVGNAALHQHFLDAMLAASTPQERSRFLLALCGFRAPKLIDKTLALTLTKTVSVQDVVFVLTHLLANPAAKEQCWSFIIKRWNRLQKRLPPLLANRLIEATPSLLSDTHRREVALFFREHPLPNGERALRQALERFAWYKGFRRKAAADLSRWAGV